MIYCYINIEKLVSKTVHKLFSQSVTGTMSKMTMLDSPVYKCFEWTLLIDIAQKQNAGLRT